ncbi:MAG: VOC family protein [Anaerolineales bacterium]|nr:VOC family protein [Anaerolineales bacterium]
MARILGVNAIVLFANDPATLAAWYERRLGLATLHNLDDDNWYGEIDDPRSGLTFQFAIFPARSPLTSGGRGLMVTYRVDDLDQFLRGLEAEGERIERMTADYGRFARLQDPEGNPIELWAWDQPEDVLGAGHDHHGHHHDSPEADA